MSTTTLTEVKETSATRINEIFEIQKKHQYAVANTTAKQRISKLKKFHKAILKYRPEIKEALYKDFRKHPSEVDLTEIYPITSEIKHTKSHLREWMDKQSVGTPLALMGSSSYVHQEPKGVVLIVAPWNFPVNLTFAPLVSAIAAGNTVMIKPSEMTPNASAVMQKIIDETFDTKEVALVQGGVETSKALLDLPFNHIFFTGSPQIGKIVMGAAAKNLTSVTLELGGKSPTIIDETANVEMAAKRTAWGKFVNNGQICIAPDYIFVHESKKEAFIKAVTKNLKEFYTEDAAKQESYSRIVNKKHFDRIAGLVEDAVERGAKIEFGGNTNSDENYIAPTILSNVPMDSKVMTEEIFGPILPIHSFNNLDEVINIINEREKPLALYIYSKSRKNTTHIMNNTRAGGSCINHNGVHFYNANLPFGGSNNSGIGKGGGYYGFQAFSNARGVLKQNVPNALELLVPPYNDFKQKLIDLTIKWF
jgi:aldehyde dehydrogenase (NAD+)